VLEQVSSFYTCPTSFDGINVDNASMTPKIITIPFLAMEIDAPLP